MSNIVFPFSVLRPYTYPAHHETTIVALRNGQRSVRAELGTYGQYRVRFTVRVPGNSETNETWQAFLRARQGAYDSFLFKDRKTELFYKVTAETPGGTINGSNTDFTLVMKHIDAASLVVRRNGATTTAYTLLTNNTAPTIRYDVAPTTSVGADYEFYMPVRLEGDPEQGEWLGGDSNFRTRIIELVETAPGAHRV